MNHTYIRENLPLLSIILFIIVFTAIQSVKPYFLYNKNGSVREFGVGYRNKTILPIWLLSIILGILCYLVILYYITAPRLF
jgi:hypothetical protein